MFWHTIRYMSGKEKYVEPERIIRFVHEILTKWHRKHTLQAFERKQKKKHVFVI